jgi:hypothetical protein
MKNSHLLEISFFIFLSVLIHSYVSTILGIISADGSGDFQWKPAKCVFEGINHYSSYLNNDGRCLKFMAQLGEYAQGFYIIIFPFTFLEWNTAKIFWSLLNIILIILVPLILSRKFKLSKNETYLIIFFILYSIIVRVNLINGQQTIFVLFFLILPFVFKSKLSSFLSGISYFKYNIGYALFLFFIISKKYKQLFLSILPCFLGILSYCLITNSNFIDNLFQPIQLMVKNSEVGSTLNRVFFFSFIKYLPIGSQLTKYLFILILTFLFNIFFINKIYKINDNLLKLSCLCLLILISTPHWGHDYILLVPLLIYSVKHYKYNLFLFRTNLFVVIYFLHLYNGMQIYLNKILFNLKFNVDILNFVYPYINIILLLLILIWNIVNNISYKKPIKKSFSSGF